MKKNRIGLLVAILLAGAAAYFLLRDNFSTVRTEDRDFAIEDTASITRIFLADRNNNKGDARPERVRVEWQLKREI